MFTYEDFQSLVGITDRDELMSAVAQVPKRQFIANNNLNSVADVYSLLRDSFKDILQELMEAELDASLGYEKNQKGDAATSNKRNGHSPKTLKSQYGEFQIDVPRDREGEFEPKLIPKYQRDVSGIEEKVISLYARGMSTRDIHDQIKELYGMELSAEMVSKITDRILPEIKEWQSRPLNPVYPFVFMDCIHYKVREDGRILSRAAYIVLGITADGYKDILSITVGANETSRFWLGMLNDLKNRGVQDVLFFCVDGLSGFKEAISAVYPDAQIQRCVIHMLRNSFKYVNYSDLKKFSSDFKSVYNAPNEAAALSEFLIACLSTSVSAFAIFSFNISYSIESTSFNVSKYLSFEFIILLSNSVTSFQHLILFTIQSNTILLIPAVF